MLLDAAMQTFANRNKRGKNLSVCGTSLRQNFRVPLDAKNKRMFCTFDPLDDSVRSGGVDDETFAWIADSLMMGGINFHCLAVKNFVQQRAAQQL